ncbi:uncharacterized protein LOC143523258 [Brachyhypopomus gauderio]|uniref:uncharacterized protein LOC143523258 n=1 Tax=Brachyhypopomus gauderio TaxID=698409 RepID=UPI0040417D23
MDCSIKNAMESENLRRSGQEQTKEDTQMLSEQEEMFNMRVENMISMINKATNEIMTEKIKTRELVSKFEKIERKWTKKREEMKDRHEDGWMEDEKRVIEKDRKLMEEECIKEIGKMAEYTTREELEKIKLRQEIYLYQENEKARLREIEELRQKLDKQVEKMKENEKIKRELEEREKVRQQEWEKERKTLVKCRKEVDKMKWEIEQERNRMRDERKREQEELTREKVLYLLKVEQMMVRTIKKMEVKKDGKPESSVKRTLGRWWKSWKKTNHEHCRSQESSVQKDQDKSSANTAELSSCPDRSNPESQSSADRGKETRKKSIWQKWFKC